MDLTPSEKFLAHAMFIALLGLLILTMVTVQSGDWRLTLTIGIGGATTLGVAYVMLRAFRG